MYLKYIFIFVGIKKNANEVEICNKQITGWIHTLAVSTKKNSH